MNCNTSHKLKIVNAAAAGDPVFFRVPGATLVGWLPVLICFHKAGPVLVHQSNAQKQPQVLARRRA